MHRATLLAALAVAAAWTSGCDAADAPEPADGSAPPGAAAPADAAVDLAPVNQSEVTGTVRADHGSDGTTVTVEVTGLRPGIAYPAHIHAGRCAAGGPVAVPLGQLRPGEDGRGRLRSRVSGSQLNPAEPAFVQVHDAAGEVLACADLAGHEGGETPLTESIREGAADTAARGGA